MRSTPSLEPELVLSQIAGHFAAGSLCFLAIGLVALAADFGQLRELAADPRIALCLVLSGFVTFSPVIFCVAVASVRHGEQGAGCVLNNDHPCRNARSDR